MSLLPTILALLCLLVAALPPVHSQAVSSSSAPPSSANSTVRVIGGATYTFDFCKPLTFGELCWLTVADVITIAYAYKWSGWLGLGFSAGGDMVGSSAVIGWAGGSVPAYCDDYYLANQNDGGNRPATNLALLNKSATIDASGTTTLLFSRPLDLPSTSKAYPFGVITPLTGNTLIEAHGPLPSSGANSVAYHGSGNHASDSVSFASGAVVAVHSDINDWKAAHAALMTLAFGLLFPLGILAARFMKDRGPIWFHLHRAFVLSALALLIAGFAIAIHKLDTPNYPTHRGIGIYVFAAMLFQPLNALVRPPPPSKGEQPTLLRAVWAALHMWNARIAYVLAIVNIGIGFSILQPDTRYKIVFWVLWGAIMLAGVALQVWVWVRGAPQQAVAGATDKPVVVAKSAADAPRGEGEAA